jgi:hypothetical protein
MQQQFECLDRSLLIQDLLGGIGTDLNFKVNGNVHPHYTCLSCFVSTIHEPRRKKHRHNLPKFQETTHTNVKDCFSVL